MVASKAGMTVVTMADDSVVMLVVWTVERMVGKLVEQMVDLRVAMMVAWTVDWRVEQTAESKVGAMAVKRADD